MWSARAPTTTREARVLPETAPVPALVEDLGTSQYVFSVAQTSKSAVSRVSKPAVRNAEC
jgi:hypothetical protein